MGFWNTRFGLATANAALAYERLVDTQGKLNEDPLNNGNPDKPITGGTKKASINGVVRTPWVMTTTEWQKTGRGMVWEANPSDVTWSMAQRSRHTKNLRGTVLHVWPDSERGTLYDEFRLHFNFQSGSILPILDGQYKPSGGIQNFYDFMQLLDTPKLTTDDPPVPNLVKIYYNSNLFPKITLTGMFDTNGISFTDSSSTPNQVTGWGADFIVYDSSPRLSGNLDANIQSNNALLQIWQREKIQNNPDLATLRNSRGAAPIGSGLSIERSQRGAENFFRSI